MKRYKTLFETLRLPLKILFVGFVFIGIGYLVKNESVNLFYTITNSYILILAEALNRIGMFIIVNFPLLVIVKLIVRRSSSSVPIISAIAGYAAFLVFTMIFASIELPSTVFSNVMGISFNASSIPNAATGTRYPLQLGIVASFIVGFSTRVSFSESRRRSQYSLLSFMDKDTWAIVVNIIYCSVLGFIVAILYPFFYSWIKTVIDFIASDITNPMSLFIYGIFERILSILGMGNLIRQPFWYQSYGGSWMSIVGESFQGDVNVWTSMMNSGSLIQGFGRFITPFYVMNIFAIPGMILAFFSLYTDKMERRKVQLFLLFAIIVSIFTGCLLPLELVLLFLAPLLLLMHIVVMGALYGIFQALNVFLGFKYAGPTIVALPGTLPDLLYFIRDPNFASTLQVICIVGVICFVLYFAMTRFYFDYMAFDLFNTGQSKKITEGLLLAVGGADNIKMINASPLRLTVQVNDIRLINFDHIQRLGATKVVETRAGFAMSFGASSIMIRKLVLKRIKDSKRK